MRSEVSVLRARSCFRVGKYQPTYTPDELHRNTLTQVKRVYKQAVLNTSLLSRTIYLITTVLLVSTGGRSTMKIFIALSCLLALASAQYYGGHNNGGQQRYNGPIHVPVIGPNGVPQEPPEVVAARRSHLANFQGVQPQAQYNPGPQQYQPQNNYGQPPAPVQPRYNGPLARIGPDGMPQYDPQVAAARAAHQAAYSEVIARNGALQSQVGGHQNRWG